jgi:hypothetical protein
MTAILPHPIFGESKNNTGTTEGREDRAGDIQSQTRLIRLSKGAERHADERDADRDVDEEDQTPRHLGQCAADDQTGDRSDARHGGKNRDGLITSRTRGESRGNKGEGGGRRHGCADTLKRPRRDQHALVQGETTEQRRHREQRDSRDEHLLAPVRVTEATTEEHEPTERKRVRGQHPITTTVAQPEVCLQWRQREVRDGAVEHHHHLQTTQDDDGEPDDSSRYRGIRRSGFRHKTSRYPASTEKPATGPITMIAGGLISSSLTR